MDSRTERREQRKALEASARELGRLARRLEKLGDVAIESLVVLAADRTIESASRSTLSMLGYRPGELVGEPFGAILEGGQSAASALLGRAAPYRSEAMYLAKDGRRVAVLLNVESVRDEETGAPEAIVCAALDLSEQGRSVEELIGHERRLRAIVEAVPDMMFRLDSEGTYLDFAPAAKDMTQPIAPPERLLGRRLTDVLPAPSVGPILAVIKKTLETQEIQTYEYSLRYDGERLRYFEGRSVPVVGADEVIWFAREITDLRRAEQELCASEERFRVMAETTDDVIYLRHIPTGKLVYVNPSGQTVFGRSPEQLCRNREGWTELIHLDDQQRVREAFARVTSEGRYDESYRILRSDGEVRWLRDRGFVASHDQVLPMCVVGNAQDVTEQRQLEEELRQSQKMDAVGQLASGVAHDFRNLMMGIVGCAKIVREKLDDPEIAGEFLDEIEAAARAGNTITQQLLEYARRGGPSLESHDLDTLVEEATTMLRVMLGDEITLVTRLHAGRPVWLDKTQFQQVLMNLTSNARDAMKGGGQLAIETRVVWLDAREAEPIGLDPGPYAYLIVTDTGRGMPDEIRRRALEPFFTTKEVGKGTGLGLSAVYAIVKQAGGHLEIRSSPSAGTTVEIRLPVAAADSAAIAAGPEPEPPESSPGTVLLVEDDPVVRRINRYYLTEAGYRVLEAGSGTEAVEVCQTSREPIDVLLADVMLPGTSSMNVAAEVSERNPRAKIVYMSAFPTDWLVREGKIPEDHRSLQKPFDKQALLEAIRS